MRKSVPIDCYVFWNIYYALETPSARTYPIWRLRVLILSIRAHSHGRGDGRSGWVPSADDRVHCDSITFNPELKKAQWWRIKLHLQVALFPIFTKCVATQYPVALSMLPTPLNSRCHESTSNSSPWCMPNSITRLESLVWFLGVGNVAESEVLSLTLRSSLPQSLRTYIS